MRFNTMVSRIGDMSPTERISVGIDGEGDAYISIGLKTVEFCSAFGGGRSPNTRNALITLMEAIEEDNKIGPMQNGLVNQAEISQ